MSGRSTSVQGRRRGQRAGRAQQWRQTVRDILASAVAAVRRDARGTRVLCYGAALFLLTTCVTLVYYLNKPQVALDPDTPAYLVVAQRILTGHPVDPGRLPGYPLLMNLVFAFAGRGNLGALSAVQAALFVVATVELYALLYLVLQRAWAAALVALLVGSNTMLLSYVKPILSEALTLFLLVNLALAVACCIRRMDARMLWIVAGWMVVLFLTRPEWIYAPVPLFAYFALLAWRRGLLRRLTPHLATATLALYLVLGGYVLANRIENGYTGVTYIQNINTLGKVMQYGMQDQAPPRYAGLTRVVDSYVARGDTDPWDVLRSGYPPITPHYFALLGEYGSAIIREHPLEYLGHSAPLALQSLAIVAPFHPVPPNPLLSLLDPISATVIGSLVLFPLLALLWWGLLVRTQSRVSLSVEIMAALALLGFYGLALTTLGGYIYYPRLHTPFAPLLIAVVWGSIAKGALILYDNWQASRASS